MRDQDGHLRNVLFLSYASEDRDICAQLAGFMKFGAKQLGYEVWWDQSQRPGERWSAQLEEQLSRTGAAIVLVSIDALNSDFIWTEEVGRLLREGVPVAPLLVRAYPWEYNEYLAPLQFLTPPGVETDLVHSDREYVLAELSRRLRRWLPDLEDEHELRMHLCSVLHAGPPVRAAENDLYQTHR